MAKTILSDGGNVQEYWRFKKIWPDANIFVYILTTKTRRVTVLSVDGKKFIIEYSSVHSNLSVVIRQYLGVFNTDNALEIKYVSKQINVFSKNNTTYGISFGTKALMLSPKYHTINAQLSVMKDGWTDRYHLSSTKPLRYNIGKTNVDHRRTHFDLIKINDNKVHYVLYNRSYKQVHKVLIKNKPTIDAIVTLSGYQIEPINSKDIENINVCIELLNSLTIYLPLPKKMSAIK